MKLSKLQIMSVILGCFGIAILATDPRAIPEGEEIINFSIGTAMFSSAVGLWIIGRHK